MTVFETATLVLSNFAAVIKKAQSLVNLGAVFVNKTPNPAAVLLIKWALNCQKGTVEQYYCIMFMVLTLCFKSIAKGRNY